MEHVKSAEASRYMVVAGASGFVGDALIRAACDEGWKVVRLVRGTAKQPDEVEWDPDNCKINVDVLRHADAVICLNGSDISQGILTRQGRKELIASRIFSVRTLAEAMALLPTDERPKVFVSASAIGYYGYGGDQELIELSDKGEGFLAELCAAWEAAANAAEDAGIRVVYPRFGLIWGEGGGIAERMISVYQRRAGAVLGAGEQWMSLVAIDDVVAALLWLIDSKCMLAGPVNITCPQPVRQYELHSKLEDLVGKTSFLWAPDWALQILPARIVNEMLLISQRVVPQRLLEAGYTFKYSTIDEVLEAAFCEEEE